MKTITLDDEAYNRLKAWKKNSSESFSTVVKRLVPEAGSLGAFLAWVLPSFDQMRQEHFLLQKPFMK